MTSRSLAVAGGYYEEICAEPYWHESFGSGGRAAAAVSGRGASIQLFTYCPANHESGLRHFASTLGFSVTPSPASSKIQFRYLHWLRSPAILPPREQLEKLPPIRVEGEAVLRFGLYEGDAVIKAQRAVYDPQDGIRSTAFHENGSDAEELVIVCNYGEGVHLTGERDPRRIISTMLGAPRVGAVLLKGAWEGLLAATESTHEHIEPIPTRSVFKVGSGDILSAEFSYHWAVLGLDPIAAAREANQRVAYYCENASLPIPQTVSITPATIPLLPPVDGEEKRFDVYLAAPFFNAGQLAVVDEMALLLSQAGVSTFSPYHHVGLGESAKVAAQDLAGLESSRFVLACLDGYDPGTVFEIGYARSAKIPVLIYSPNIGEPHITMFAGTGCEIVRDFTSAIYRAIWWAKGK
ncbi:MAG TPA: nucleoside 2-deoxyribosyltransferase [Terriglobales bacterium]|nr:nucleoside 2-deoxyribosyltransferase [Terriglobales bacterium]